MSLVGRLAGTLAWSRESQGHKQRPEGPGRIDPAGGSVSSMSQALAHLCEELDYCCIQRTQVVGGVLTAGISGLQLAFQGS